jgi:hypothetical protein
MAQVQVQSPEFKPQSHKNNNNNHKLMLLQRERDKFTVTTRHVFSPYSIMVRKRKLENAWKTRTAMPTNLT